MDVSPLVLISVLSLLLLFAIRKPSQNRRDAQHRLPPSPPGLPVIGHLPFLGSLAHRKLRSMATTYGPVMLLRFGRVPTVVASSAAAAQEMMKTRDLAYASRPCGPIAERLLYGGRDMVFAPYGEYWRKTRRVCVLHVLSQRCVLSFRRVREQETAALLDRVRGATSAVNLSNLLVTYSGAVSLRVVFGFGNDGSSYGLEGEGKILKKLLVESMELLALGTLSEFVPWLWWVDSLTGVHAKATRTFQALDALLERGIADHRARRHGGQQEGDAGGGDGDDDSRRSFVSVLLDAKEKEEKAGEILFDTVTIKAIIMDMFVAGADTPTAVMEWVMAELINHPNEMHKLQEEIRTVIRGGVDNQVNEDHLGKLRHLKPVIKETLRLHTPAPLVVRETTEDTELLGYHVPARASVLINVWAIARDPATWERAEEFLPERWLDDDEYGAVAAGHDFTFLPFGGGRRGCPGAGFGMASVELALVGLLYHFDWEMPAAGPPTVDMDDLMSGLSLRLKKPLRLVAKPWSP